MLAFIETTLQMLPHVLGKFRREETKESSQQRPRQIQSLLPK
jgi:hypothetical protein